LDKHIQLWLHVIPKGKRSCSDLDSESWGSECGVFAQIWGWVITVMFHYRTAGNLPELVVRPAQKLLVIEKSLD
jgi:hypothetical protein